MSKKDADQLVRALRRHFADTGAPYDLVKRGGHWHVVNQAGKTIGIRFASTPSDHRFRANTVADLRRAGIVPTDWKG